MTPEHLLVTQEYFVNVKRNRKYKNIITAHYPANIFNIPPLEEETIQYYIEDNQIIVTKLSTKESKKIETNKLTTRIYVLCDIISRALKRNISLELILCNKKSNQQIINLMEIPKHLKKEELELIQLLSSALKKRKLHNTKYNDIYNKLLAIVKLGGLV